MTYRLKFGMAQIVFAKYLTLKLNAVVEVRTCYQTPTTKVFVEKQILPYLSVIINFVVVDGNIDVLPSF